MSDLHLSISPASFQLILFFIFDRQCQQLQVFNLEQSLATTH